MASSRARAAAGRPLVGAALILLAWMGSAWSQPADPPEPPPWQELTTEHYHILSRAGELPTRRIATLMEAVHAYYQARFPLEEEGAPATMVLRILPTTEALGRYIGRPGRGYWGMYRPNQRDLVVPADRAPQELRLILLHEGFHQFLDHVAPTAPPWFHEGFAQLFQAHRLEGGELHAGYIIASYVRLLAEPDAGALDLKGLLESSLSEFHRAEGESLAYGRAWLLAHFLTNGERGRYRPLVERLVRRMGAGETIDPTGVFGDVTRVEASLEAYLQELTAVVGEFDGLYGEARAAHDAGELDRARRLYEEALEAGELIDDTRIHTCNYQLATIAQAGRHFNRAIDGYSLVIDAGVGWSAAYYQRAVCHSALGERDEAIADLEMVLELAPDYQPARVELERLRLLQQQGE